MTRPTVRRASLSVGGARIHPAYLWRCWNDGAVDVVELFVISSPSWVRLPRWLLGDTSAK